MPGIDPVPVGRPLLVIENERVNLHDGFVFEQFVEDPDKFFSPPTAAPARSHRGEEERPPRVHILAFALATRPEFKNKAQRLRTISRFDQVESQLALRLQYRGSMLRVQGFLDSLIESVLPLRDFALTVHLQSHQEARVWQSRMAEVKEEMAKWSHGMRKSLRKNAAAPLESLRGQLDALVNKHGGNADADEQWNSRLEALSFAEHTTDELQRIESEYREKATSLADRLKPKRQPGEGPLPQPVILGTLPQEFKDATAKFHEALRAVGDPLHWTSSFDEVSVAPDTQETLPQAKDQLGDELRKRLDAIEKKLSDALEGQLMAHVVAPVEHRLVTESRGLIEALVHLGREGGDTLEVMNEVLLSLTQRLIERAAEHNRIRLPLIQKLVREPGHRTKLLVPPSRDLFPLARRLQDALGERVDLVPSVESPEARIAAALLPAKIKADMVTINEDKRMAQVRVPRKESGKAFGRNASNQRLAAALSGYHLHLRISKEAAVTAPTEDAATEAPQIKRKRSRKKPAGATAPDVTGAMEQVAIPPQDVPGDGAVKQDTESAAKAEPSETEGSEPAATSVPVKDATPESPVEAQGQDAVSEDKAGAGETGMSPDKETEVAEAGKPDETETKDAEEK